MTQQKKIPPAAFAPSQKEELPAASLERNVVSRDESKTEKSTRDSVSPYMAPSLKRRSETKKRGFFKRLFGIK
jgi:hypothetical protein